MQWKTLVGGWVGRGLMTILWQAVPSMLPVKMSSYLLFNTFILLALIANKAPWTFPKANIKKIKTPMKELLSKQDRFTACFKTYGTGSLFWRVGRRCKVTLVPRLCRQTNMQDWRGRKMHKSRHKSVQKWTDRHTYNQHAANLLPNQGKQTWSFNPSSVEL